MGCCGEGAIPKEDQAKKEAPRGGHPDFYEILNKQAELHDRKNTDYAAGGKQGPLGNFRRVSAFTRMYPGFDWTSAFGVCMMYALKQLDAAFILYATKRESITGEPIPARLNDVSVYMNIGQIIHKEDALQQALVDTLREQVKDAMTEAANRRTPADPNQLELPSGAPGSQGGLDVRS